MRSVLLAAVTLTGFLTLMTPGASAAQSIAPAALHAEPVNGMVATADYHRYWHHRHWHHRHWHHARRYY
jgi:hypothetical protein